MLQSLETIAKIIARENAHVQNARTKAKWVPEKS